MASSRRALWAWPLLIALTISACSLNGLNFTQDERVVIKTPRDRQKVSLPVRLAWEVTGFEVTGPDGSRKKDSGFFGVFIDRAPPSPGETPESLVKDPACDRNPTCPNKEYLAGIGIHATTETSLTLDRLDDLFPLSDRRELHTVTVVFLDGVSRRIGESAFEVEFEIIRES